MTAAPDLGPESGLLARIKAHPAARRGVKILRWLIPVALLVNAGVPGRAVQPKLMGAGR